jgi:choline dehydrogenase-like flavoprotein
LSIQHEKLVPPADGHNTTGQIIPSLHGTNGMLPVSLPANNQTIDPRVIKTTQQLAEFPYNGDMSGGDHSLLGIGWLKSSMAGGVRSSSSTTYLAAANGRPNLTVVINAYVTKLIQTGTGSQGTKSFRSVQFTNSPGTGTTPAGQH